jgi:glycosyltransferase involved in cell wall biosynthesis
MSDVIIVVPCYNEAGRLKLDAFAEFLDTHGDIGFVFVDDGSTDATGPILREWASERSQRCSVWALAENAGKAEAVRQGVGRAFERSAAYVGYWDADLSTPLSEIAPMRELLEGRPELEMVFGSRVQLLGREIRRNPVRHYLGRVFATVISLMLGIPVYDTQCGAKLFKSSPTVQSLFAEPFVARWVFDVEIIARLIAASGPEGRSRTRDVVAEYPLHSWQDVAGSKLHPQDFLHAAGDAVRIYRRYLTA